MDSTAAMPFTDDEMSQPIMEMPVINEKDIISEPTTKVEQILSNGIHEVVAYEDEDEDDDCVICYATLYRPVKTECGHSACEGCMLHWALAAMDECIEQTELPSNLTVDGIKFKCPTCRTYTTANFDAELDARLHKRHPEEYAARAAEQREPEDSPEDEYATKTMLIMLGNSHRKVDPTPSPYTGSMRHHEWTFFVKSSQPELIEEIQVILHPTFREDRLVTLREPPFSITHKGWGYFTIFAGLQLKKGYEWIDEERAVSSNRDRKKDRLPFDWLLDFRGNGSQTNRLVKFRKIQSEAEQSDEEMADLGVLAEFMSETEIEQLREVRRLKRAARRAQEALEKEQDQDVAS